jgi:hypothetical protein
MKYCFDVVDGMASAFDFHGQEFSNPDEAYALAELLSLDLTVRGLARSGSAITVLDAHGKRHFSVPVQITEPEDE